MVIFPRTNITLLYSSSSRSSPVGQVQLELAVLETSQTALHSEAYRQTEAVQCSAVLTIAFIAAAL
jgi:hypothetical protein